MELSALGWNKETVSSCMIVVFTIIQVGLLRHQYWIVRQRHQKGERVRAIAPEIYLYQIFLCMLQVLFSILEVEFSVLMFSAGTLRILVLLPLVIELFRYEAVTRLQNGMIVSCIILLVINLAVHRGLYAHVIEWFYVVALVVTVVPLSIQIRKLYRAATPGEGTVWVPLITLVSTACWALYYFSFGIQTLMWVAILLSCWQAVWMGLWIGAWRTREQTKAWVQSAGVFDPVQHLQGVNTDQ